MSSTSPPQFDPLRFVDLGAVVRTREERIAELAYDLARKRGFAPGHEVEDWLAAEAAIDQRDP